MTDNRIRYKLEEIQRNAFFQMPKFLFEEEFKNMSNDARVLYSLLKDRHELSVKNKWVNENNEVFLICSRETMQNMLGLSENTITKSMKVLKKFNLIDEERQGLGRPNKIYLLATVSTDFTNNRKFYGSGTADFAEQKPQILSPNKTNTNNTYISDTKSMSCQSQTEQKEDLTMTNDIDHKEQILSEEMRKEPVKPQADQSKGLKDSLKNSSINNDYNTYKTIIQDNIDYQSLLQSHARNINEIDELVSAMLDVICTKGDTVKINGEEKNREMVKSVYLKIDAMDIEHILDRFQEQRHKITHINSYLKTMLYITKLENSHYYTNAVRVDGAF